MSETIKTLLQPIQNRLNAATPGPWSHGRGVTPYVAKRDWVEVENQATICHDVRPADAEFIAHAPTDQARLLAAVKAVVDLADAWQARGEHLKKSAETSPWDVQESLDDAGADFINNARLIRSELVKALTEAR